MIKTIDQVIAEHPWLEAMRDRIQEACHDCKARLGQTHQRGCDAEFCSICGGQWIACGHKTALHEEFVGVLAPHLVKRAVEDGLWCRSLLVYHIDGSEQPIRDGLLAAAMELQRAGTATIRWHQPCKPDDDGAHPDLNRAADRLARRST